MWRRQLGAVALSILALLLCRLPARLSAGEDGSRRLTFSILEDYDKDDPLADVEQDFTLFHELGITTWRGSFGWDAYEPSRGQYDFAWLDSFAALAERDGITLRPYIGYTPAWAAAGGHDMDAWNDPPRNLDDWGAFVKALATTLRTHGNIASYEIYNEENAAQWWNGTPTQYADVLARAADAIHEASPGTPVMLGGMVYPDAAWIHHVCGEAHDGNRFAILPFHAYPETWTPPDVDLEHYLGPHFEDGFVSEADRECGRKPIWINETGFATVGDKTERDQAEWWMRAIATFASTPRVEHIGVYEIKDLRADSPAIGGAANYHLGLMTASRKRKLAFQTVKDLAGFLGDEPIAIDDRVRLVGGDHGDLYAHALRRGDGRELVVVWTKHASRTVDIEMPARFRAAVEHDLDGGTSPISKFDGRVLTQVKLDAGHPRAFELVP
ncbi:MAG TPA: beta-galactosidase [Vicinamibacterales bacterium]|nr:beta-galactosidase [Vicinamibacterales bacterium]